MWSTVLFDLDGTISDSAEGITRSVQYALEKEFGIIRQPEELLEFVGPPLKEQFMLYTGCDEAMGERAVWRYRERYRPVGIFENKLYPGIPELLKQLYDEHFTIALSSSKPEAFCRQILEAFHIAEYFTVICGSDMDGKHTDKAEVIEQTIHRLGAEHIRDEIVLVGDRRYDIIGARQCGISSIGVSFGYGSREELEHEWPDCIVDTVTELRNVLIGQARAGRRAESPFSPEGRAARRKADGGPVFKLWRLCYPILLHYGISNLVMLLGMYTVVLISAGMGILGADAMDKTLQQSVLLTGIADAVVIPVAWLFFNSDRKKRAANKFDERILKKNIFGVPEIVGIIVIAIGCSTVLNWLIALIPFQDTTYESTAEVFFKNTGLMTQLVVIGILAPIAEEFIFRGLIFRRGKDYFGFLLGALFSALSFGIYHGNLTQGIFAFFMGMLFCAMYEHYGTLWAPIAAHMANNLFATLENSVFSKLKIPDIAYLLFSVVIAGAALICMFLVVRNEPKVNDL